MKRNSRLSLALHTLSHMAAEPNKMSTSADIAAHVGTNPVVVRRVLGKLREAGLLVSEKGPLGGWRLARAPDAITLADIYLSLEETLISAKDETTPDCAVEHALQRRLFQVLDEVEDSLVQRLRETTIAEVSE